MSKHRVLLVGCGAMGGALMQGWVKSGTIDFDFEIVTPSPRTDFHLLQHQTPASYEGNPDIIVFAVKPQILDDIVADYVSVIGPNTLITSVAAGKPLAFFKKHFPKNPVMRAMPNLPAAVNKGVTLLTKCADTDKRDSADALFSKVGTCFWADEKMFDTMTALTGSGPAYIYLLTEVIGDLIKKQGFTAADAIEMAKDLVAGSAELMQHSPVSPADLREAVTSPKGVTDAALKVLMPDMQKLFDKAIDQASKRSKELSK